MSAEKKEGLIISELSERQMLFCRLAASGMAPGEAAKKAGYKRSGVENVLLQNEKILKTLKSCAEESPIADSSEILELLTSVMRGDVHDPVIVVEQKTGADGKTQKLARVINKSASVKERMSAAEMLARRYGILHVGEEDSGVILYGEEKITDCDEAEN